MRRSRHAAPLRAVIDQVESRVRARSAGHSASARRWSFPTATPSATRSIRSLPTKRFQLPLYRGKPYPPVHFDQAGVVTLGCNIHDDMLAYLVVTDAPWFGRTDAAGAWSTELPRGRYRVALWHPRLRESDTDLERELTVAEGDRAELTLNLSKPLQPAPARRIVRTPGITEGASHGLPRKFTRRRRARACAAHLAARAFALARCRRHRQPAPTGRLSLDGRLVSSDANRLFHGRGPGHGALRQRRIRSAAGTRTLRAHAVARRAVECTSRRLDVRRQGPKSRRRDRGLSAVPPLSARGLPLSPEGRRVLSADIARESRLRLGITLHAVLLGHRQLARSRGAHHRTGRNARLARHAQRSCLRPGSHRRGVRLERRRGSQCSRTTASASPTGRRRCSAGSVSRASPPLYGAEPFLQFDHREGAYAGIEARYLDRVVLRVLRYDNRADPTQLDSVSRAIAWDTRFTSAGVRIEGEHGWTAIVQWLSGETTIDLGRSACSLSNWPFRAEYALFAKRFGLAHPERPLRPLRGATPPRCRRRRRAGRACLDGGVCLQCRRALALHARVAAGGEQFLQPRGVFGGAPLLTETQLQLAIRYALGSTIR